MSVRGSLQEREIGEHLGGLAAQVEVARPDWDAVRGGVRRVRRRRRMVRAGKGVGSVVAAVAVAGSLQVGLLPYPSWAPAVPVSATDGSGLADGPTRGSLAGDEPWLDEFRQRVVSLPAGEPGRPQWRIPSTGDVDVVYAGDVGRTRVALVEASYRWGLLSERRQVWFLGNAGAAAAGMARTSTGPPSDLAVIDVGGTRSDGVPAPALVVVGARDRRVEVEAWGTVEADGSVTRERTSLRTGEDGLLEWTAPGSGPYEVRVEGEAPRILGADDTQERVAGWTGRGARVDGMVVRSGAGAGARGLSLLAALPEQVWAGGDEPGSPVLLSVPAPSGAALVVMGRVAQPVPWRTPEQTDPPAMTVDARATVAADEEPVVAWQLGDTVWSHQGTGESWVDPDETWYRRHGASGTVAVVGPPAAVQADVLSADGTVLRAVVLAGGGGVADADGAVRVRFLGEDGTEVGSADVVPWTEDGATADLGR